MPDPRIERTRNHVLTTARRLLGELREPLTFTNLAAAAQVSRRTLYVHFGTVEKVISEALSIGDLDDAFDPAGLTLRQRLEEFLTHVRSTMSTPVTRVAMATLVNRAVHDDSAAAELRSLSEAQLTQFRELVGPISPDDYANLVGPIVYSQWVANEPASEALLRGLVERGISTIGTRSVERESAAS